MITSTWQDFLEFTKNFNKTTPIIHEHAFLNLNGDISNCFSSRRDFDKDILSLHLTLPEINQP